MMRTTAIALLVLLPPAENPWTLKKDQDGIQVYTREMAGSAIAEFKAEVTLEHTRLLDVLDVITDVGGFVNLFPGCTEATVLERKDRYNTVHYIRTAAPFPLRDRDGVYEQRTRSDPDGGHATVTIRALSGQLPVQKDLVRMTHASGTWQLTRLGSSVKVVYQFHGDPGGDVPAWVVNSFIVDNPFGTLLNLRKIVAR